MRYPSFGAGGERGHAELDGRRHHGESHHQQARPQEARPEGQLGVGHLRRGREQPPNSELRAADGLRRDTKLGAHVRGLHRQRRNPAVFEIASSSYDKFRFPAGGRVELAYHLDDATISGKADGVTFEGVDGEDIIVETHPNGETRSVRFRVTVDPGLHGAMPPPEQVVEYFPADPQSPDDNHVRPRLRIRNKGAQAVPLSEFTMRYWYTSEGLQAEQAWFDYVAPSLGAANLTTRFNKLRPLTGADGFIEVGFKPGAGDLAPNSVTGEAQLRFNKGDWANYHESDDYSYDPTKTTYTESPKVTLYRNGVLVYGTEPTPLDQSQIVRAMSIFIRDEALTEQNIVKPRMFVVNTATSRSPVSTSATTSPSKTRKRRCSSNGTCRRSRPSSKTWAAVSGSRTTTFRARASVRASSCRT